MDRGQDQDDEMMLTRDKQTEFFKSLIAIVPADVPPEQLPAVRDALLRAMHMIDLELAQVRADLGVEGAQENARWWARATAAQRIKGKQRQRMQALHTEINRLIRVQRNIANQAQKKSQERRFIELAKPILGETKYLELWRIVQAEFPEITLQPNTENDL